AIGAAFGMLFSVVSYSFTGGKRDFTSQSQIVASSYAVLCHQEKANQARNLLAEVGGVTSGWGTPTPTPTPPATAPQSDPAPGGAPTSNAPSGTPETPERP